MEKIYSQYTRRSFCLSARIFGEFRLQANAVHSFPSCSTVFHWRPPLNAGSLSYMCNTFTTEMFAPIFPKLIPYLSHVMWQYMQNALLVSSLCHLVCKDSTEINARLQVRPHEELPYIENGASWEVCLWRTFQSQTGNVWKILATKLFFQWQRKLILTVFCMQEIFSPHTWY